MNTSFKEFANRRNIEIGIRCLIEAENMLCESRKQYDQSFALDIPRVPDNSKRKLPSKQQLPEASPTRSTEAVPPIPKNIEVPQVPPKEKSWARKWWDKNKTMLKYGALGAAAIGLLLGSGVPWGSLFPFMARTIGAGLGANAILGGANSIMGTAPEQSGIDNTTKIIIRDHDCFVKTKFGEVKVSPSEIPDMILRNSDGSGDYSAVIWRTETSRAGIEHELSNALRDKGLENSVLWRSSFEFNRSEPNTVNVPEFE